MKATKNDNDRGTKAPRAKISEEERTQVRSLTNSRIQHACSFAALVIILIDLAAYVIGEADHFFTTAGIMIAIALLAIGMLNNPTESRQKNAPATPANDTPTALADDASATPANSASDQTASRDA